MINALTIDVEDYYMVSAFSDAVKFKDWHTYESRVENSTGIILDLLDSRAVKATFFILGWVAERYPSLVRDIHARGHEIASHGYDHRLVYDLTPEEFRNDTRKARLILEDITGERILGYRAASYSIVERNLWALDILIEEEIAYDSSIFPIRHDRYGMPGAKRFPHRICRNGGSILEFPPSTLKVGPLTLPVAGGGYFRLLPLALTRYAINHLNRVDHEVAMVYLHPWEIDPGQPRINGTLVSRLRHYVNIGQTYEKLSSLLAEFNFSPLKSLLHQYP